MIIITINIQHLDHPHLLHLSKVIDEKDVDALSRVLEITSCVLQAGVNLIGKDGDLVGQGHDHADDEDDDDAFND